MDRRLLTVVAGTVIGIILAVMRLGKRRPCEWLVRFYIWIIRGTPSLLQLYFFYLLLPKVLPIEIPPRPRASSSR